MVSLFLITFRIRHLFVSACVHEDLKSQPKVPEIAEHFGHVFLSNHQTNYGQTMFCFFAEQGMS